jgi:release factor glutamine methyltransferase
MRTLNIGQALARSNIDPVDARVLLAHVLGADHAYLVAHSERVLGPTEQDQWAKLLARRVAGEPVAYLTGSREFYGRRFRVGPAVLIPRPETELLVDRALALVGDAPEPGVRVLELGTGCGAIAVTLALERPGLDVCATEISPAAIRIAEANADALRASGVKIMPGNWFAPIEGQLFDVIVANPPYLAAGDPHLTRGDVRHEPRLALISGADGLECIRLIVRAARRHLRPEGYLLFEHGYDQAGASAQFLAAAGFRDLFLVDDLAGLPRVSGGRAPAYQRR